MSGKEDLRVKRTKKALTDAFIKLLSEKSFEEITVNELCDAAGVRRATFYKHYNDKFDFLTAYTRTLRDKFDSAVWKSTTPAQPKEYYIAYARSLVMFVDANAVAVANMLKSNIFPTMFTIILEQNYRDTCKRLEASSAAGMPLAASVEVIASMAAGAVAAAVYVWIVEGRKKSAEEIADEIGKVVHSLMDK